MLESKYFLYRRIIADVLSGRYAPIMTAADDIHKYFFIVFQKKYDLMFQVNPLLGRGFT